MHAFLTGLRRSKDFLEHRVFRLRESRFLAVLLGPSCVLLIWCLYQFSWSWFVFSCGVPLLAWYLWITHPATVSLPRVARIIDGEYRLRDLMASAHEFQPGETQSPVVAALIRQADLETQRLRFPDEYRRQKLIARVLWLLFLMLIVANLIFLLPLGRWANSASGSGPASTRSADDADGGETGGDESGAGDGQKSGSSDGSGNGGSDGTRGNTGQSQNRSDSKGSSTSGPNGQRGNTVAGGSKEQNVATGKALSALANALQKDSATSDLGKALARQNLQQAAQEAQKLSQGNPAAGQDAGKSTQHLAQSAQQALKAGGSQADQNLQKALQQMASGQTSPARQRQAFRQLAEALQQMSARQTPPANQQAGQSGGKPGTGQAPQQQQGGQNSQGGKSGQGVGGTKAGGQLDEDPLKCMNQQKSPQPGDDRLVDPNWKKQIAASAAQRLGLFEGKPELTPEQSRQREAAAQKAAQSRKVDEFAQRHRIPDQFRTYLKDFFTR